MRCCVICPISEKRPTNILFIWLCQSQTACVSVIRYQETFQSCQFFGVANNHSHWTQHLQSLLFHGSHCGFPQYLYFVPSCNWRIQFEFLWFRRLLPFLLSFFLPAKRGQITCETCSLCLRDRPQKWQWFLSLHFHSCCSIFSQGMKSHQDLQHLCHKKTTPPCACKVAQLRIPILVRSLCDSCRCSPPASRCDGIFRFHGWSLQDHSWRGRQGTSACAPWRLVPSLHWRIPWFPLLECQSVLSFCTLLPRRWCPSHAKRAN